MHTNHTLYHWTTPPVHKADFYLYFSFNISSSWGCSWNSILSHKLAELPLRSFPQVYYMCNDFQLHWGMVDKIICKWLHIFTRRNLGDQHTLTLYSFLCVCIAVAGSTLSKLWAHDGTHGLMHLNACSGPNHRTDRDCWAKYLPGEKLS